MAHPALIGPKRGYLVNVTTIPPLIYPFQYNPAQLTESKRLEWGPKYDTAAPGARGITGLIGGVQADVAAFSTGFLPGVGQTLSTATEVLGRVFSAAEIKRFEKEEPRTLTVTFVVDGRELRAGEPQRRRNDAGDVLGDLAVIRSFAYPQLANWLDAASALASSDRGAAFTAMWFNEPPTVTLVMGDRSFEGFVTDLKITETLFNDALNPTRAEVELTLLEKINSISAILDALKRIGRTFYYTDYEDALDAVF